MAVTKTIEVDGKEVQFRASAAIPRLYRNKFHRDIYKDLNELQKGIDENDAESIRILMSRILRRTGSTSSTPSPFMKSCLRSSSCGDSMWNSRWNLKKTSSDRAGNDNPALFTPVCADRAFHLGARPAHYRDCQ